MKGILKHSLCALMLVLFTGITSFQSIHEWLHHHQDETEHHEESCDWYSVKALPFQAVDAFQFEFSFLISYFNHLSPYKIGHGVESINCATSRGPPILLVCS